MADVTKSIVEVIQDLLDSDRWAPALDQRSAAEVMSDVVKPIMGPGRSWDCLFDEEGWQTYGWSRAGPAAWQVFDAAIMREQVDPT